MCTGYYVGSDVSADGTVLIGQTTDALPNTSAAFISVSPSDTAGRTMTFAYGFQYTFGAKTYGFNTDVADYKGTSYAGNVTTNTEGLSFIGCVTAYANDKVLSVDPYAEHGISEHAASYVIAASCSTAESAVKMYCDIVDTYGSSESGVFMVADQKEAWLIESYTGHQYAAVKLPTDKMTVFGNEFILRSVNDMVHIESSGINDVAVKAGSYVTGSDGTIDLKMSYSISNIAYSHLRTWIGQCLFAENPVTTYNNSDEYETFYTPKEKVTLVSIMDLTRNRYEGTEYCPETTDTHYRVIGTESMCAANILQIYKDLPSYMCMVRWSCMGPTEFGVFFPVSNAVNDFSDAYEKLIDSRALDQSSAYGVFKALNTICSLDRTVFKEGISTYWSNLEIYYISLNAMLLDKMKGMSHDDAVRYVTSVTMEIEDEVLDDAGYMYSECLTYYALKNKTSSNPVSPMPGYFDVASFSAKYGWTTSVVDGTYELKNGSDIVTIMDTSNYAEYKCTVTLNSRTLL